MAHPVRLPAGPAAAAALESRVGSRLSTAAPVAGTAVANVLSTAASACRAKAECSLVASSKSAGSSKPAGACADACASRSRNPRIRCRCSFAAAGIVVVRSTAKMACKKACATPQAYVITLLSAKTDVSVLNLVFIYNNETLVTRSVCFIASHVAS